jgi:hypoxanthine phosphoribosyltransferase
MGMHNDIKSILYPEEQIKQRVRELAEQISRDYGGGELLTVGILKGAVVFYSDLVREMSLPVTLDFMVLSSYGTSSVSTGVVRIQYDLEQDISGKDVLIVEDIVDSGLTLHYLTKTLASRNPKSLKVCCLFDKPSRRKIDFKPDYIGFEVPDVFIVGYGLDYSEKYRNLKYIGELKEEIYK